MGFGLDARVFPGNYDLCGLATIYPSRRSTSWEQGFLTCFENWLGVTGMARRRVPRWLSPAVGVVLLCVSAPVHSASHSVTGTVKYPCISPVPTYRGITEQGFCGYKFLIPVLTRGYRVHSHVPAEIEISFYDESGNATDQNGGPPLVETDIPPSFPGDPRIPNQCVDLVGTHTAQAKYAVVVISPNPLCSRSTDVTFTYTAT